MHKKRGHRVKRGVFQAIKTRATFYLHSVSNKDHSPQYDIFWGFQDKNKCSSSMDRDSEDLVLAPLNRPTIAQSSHSM